MAAKHQYRADTVAAALVASVGIKSAAAQRVGCSVDTIERYIQRFPTVAAAYDQSRDRLLDAAESVLVSHLQENSLEAAKYVLSTIGRVRGYGPADAPAGLVAERIERIYVGVDVEAV